MKKLFTILASVSFVAACTNDLESSFENYVEVESAPVERNHLVHFEDVRTLVNAQEVETCAGKDMAENIICYTDEEDDTLLYIYDRPEGGWVIYSSDTRVLPIVAISDSGCYEQAVKNENLAAWLQTMAKDMKAIKRADTMDLNFTKEEIKQNEDLWRSISDADSFVKELMNEGGTRADLFDPMYPFARYELYSSQAFYVPYDTIPRMTTTNWHQGVPYNNYCPRVRVENYNGEIHAPAGCVAIAAAQMLYFLHNKLSVPEMAPSTAYCYGYTDTPNNYNWGQGNYNTTIWNEMTLNPEKAAPLIANVGMLSSTIYDRTESRAYLSCLPGSVFSAYGIDCQYSDYNTETVKTSLMNGMPVILGATMMSQGNRGHAFIADRYRRSQLVYRNTYRLAASFPPVDQIVPCPPDTIIRYQYTSTYEMMIAMNWGMNGYNNNDEWFSLTGDWVKRNETYLAEDRKMVYGFSISD